MRDSETCPKCHRQKIFVVKEVGNELTELTEAGYRERGKAVPLPVAVVELPTGRTIVQAGHFEAWVCGKCGFTEWYAQDLDAIARIAEKSSGVRVIDHEADPDAGPYRD